MLRKLSFASLTLTALAALIVTGCGSGGGDRAGFGSIFSISGTVVSNTNLPLKDVSVTLYDKATSKIISATNSDLEGKYSFTSLAIGNYIVTPLKNGTSFDPVSYDASPSGTSLTLQPFKVKTSTVTSYIISGTVTDTTNKPLPNISISINAPGGFKDAIATDINGYYSFKNLANAQYTVAPPVGGVYTFVPSSLVPNVIGNDVSNQDFKASSSVVATYTLSGTVTGPLATVDGVKITLNDGSSTTTTQGVYSFKGKANATYTATPTHPGYIFSPGSDIVTINGGVASFKPFLSAIDPARSITGSAVLQGVTMTITLTGGRAILSSPTDTYGNYSFTGLANDSYTVTPSKTGFTFTPRSALVSVDGISVINGPSFIAAGKLNDTGITASQCYTTLNSNLLGACGGNTVMGSTQDGMVGRDANPATNASTDGNLGFSFTSVSAGACVQDNVTGLMWESKNIIAGDLHDWAKKYANDGTTTDASFFVTAVNAAGLCGFKDWRLPTRNELQSIVDYGVVPTVAPAPAAPTIDATWFPNTQAGPFWSSSPYAGSPALGWNVSFYDGSVYVSSRSGTTSYVRLVRAGQ